MAHLRLRVTATFTHPTIGLEDRERWMEADLSDLVQANPMLSSESVGPNGKLTQVIVCECEHLLCTEPVVVYKDLPMIRTNARRMDMLWQACCVETRDEQPYFTWEVGHNDPDDLEGACIEYDNKSYRTEDYRVFKVRAGETPRVQTYNHDDKGWFAHLKAEAFHHRDHDEWCRRVEQRRA